MTHGEENAGACRCQPMERKTPSPASMAHGLVLASCLNDELHRQSYLSGPRLLARAASCAAFRSWVGVSRARPWPKRRSALSTLAAFREKSPSICGIRTSRDSSMSPAMAPETSLYSARALQLQQAIDSKVVEKVCWHPQRSKYCLSTGNIYSSPSNVGPVDALLTLAGCSASMCHSSRRTSRLSGRSNHCPLQQQWYCKQCNGKKRFSGTLHIPR